jgi:hypothetical protein
MTHLLLHKTPNLVSSEPGAAHTEQAKLAASLWYRQKAQELSRLQGEETFYLRLVGPSDRLEEDL